MCVARSGRAPGAVFDCGAGSGGASGPSCRGQARVGRPRGARKAFAALLGHARSEARLAPPAFA
eukprot:2109388-Lingulodinium_polyedra.AAC.1